MTENPLQGGSPDPAQPEREPGEGTDRYGAPAQGSGQENPTMRIDQPGQDAPRPV